MNSENEAAPSPLAPGDPPRMASPSVVAVLGQMDCGKSTLVCRLVGDTGALSNHVTSTMECTPECGSPTPESSFALDRLQREFDSAMRRAYTRVRSGPREFFFVDAPTAEDLLAQLTGGPAQAEAGLLVLDAGQDTQREPVRHEYLAKFFGFSHIVVAVNKMDSIGFDTERYGEVRQQIFNQLTGLGLEPPMIVPVVARDGDNISRRSERMRWYSGPTLLEALAALPQSTPIERPQRLIVHNVYWFDEQQLIVGREEGAVLQEGQTLLFSPTERIARVTSIERRPLSRQSQSIVADVVAITLDSPVVVKRGDIASPLDQAPMVTNEVGLQIVWLGETPLVPGCTLIAKIGTAEAKVIVEALEGAFDLEPLESQQEVQRGQVCKVHCRSSDLLALDAFTTSPRTGRCVLMDGNRTVAAGLIDLTGCRALPRKHSVQLSAVSSVLHGVSPERRARRYGHCGTVIWLTGLSGAGKSTIAMRAEERLFHKGYHVYVLDGDNVRRGMNADLGFSADDRRENIRRAGEIAALFADAGLVVITAFISPYANDRAAARHASGGRFREVYVRASLSACEARDPRGLYRRARSGEIQQFTGVSAPYETPLTPDLDLDTEGLTIEEAVERLVSFIDERMK